jgi:hypothetical protein
MRFPFGHCKKTFLFQNNHQITMHEKSRNFICWRKIHFFALKKGWLEHASRQPCWQIIDLVGRTARRVWLIWNCNPIELDSKMCFGQLFGKDFSSSSLKLQRLDVIKRNYSILSLLSLEMTEEIWVVFLTTKMLFPPNAIRDLSRDFTRHWDLAMVHPVNW